MGVEAARPDSTTFNKQQSNHNLNATLAFIRLDLFIGEEEAAAVAAAWRETDRSSGSEGHYQTSQTDIAGIVVVIDPSPEASVRRPRSSCHLVCIQSEGVWVATAEQIYTDLHRQRMLSTSIITCRWDNAGKDRDRGGQTENQVG